MNTIVIDGKEYVLIPKEQLQPVETPPVATTPPNASPDNTTSVLEDFMGGGGTSTPPIHPDDGLATNKEKQEAIKIVLPSPNQTEIVDPSKMVTVPKATPKPSGYRERFINHTLDPNDVSVPLKFSRELLAGNPEDPMIKADSQRPKGDQLFYGPGIQYAGYS